MSTGAFTLADVDKPKGQFTAADLDQQPKKEGFWHSFAVTLPGYHEDDPWGALKDFVEGAKTMGKHPIESGKLIYHGVTDPMAATAEAGKARMKQPGIMNKISGAVEYLEGGVPGLGPMLAKAGHQIENNDWAGGLGTTTGAVLPAVLSSPTARQTIANLTGQVVDQLTPSGSAQRLYKSALKPSTTLSAQQTGKIVQAGLENKIPVSKAGLEKISNLIDDLNQNIKSTIDAGSAQGKTVNKFAVASRLGDTAQKFSTQVNPTADLNAIAESGSEFLAGQPNEIPASSAQALKQGTYAQLKGRAYGELKSATIESQKALARGLKEELATQFPEIGNLNAKESALIGLDQQMERAVNRISNHQIMGIGTPLAAAGAKAVTGSSALAAVTGIMKAIFDDPIIKSKLAISLSRGSKGAIPLAAAQNRVAQFVSSLAVPAGAQPFSNQQNERPAE